MGYLPDLSFYHGWKPINAQKRARLDAEMLEKDYRVLAVGWLEPEHQYTQGVVPKQVLKKIAFLCSICPMGMYMGHQQPLIGRQPQITAVIRQVQLDFIAQNSQFSPHREIKIGSQVSSYTGSGEFAVPDLTSSNPRLSYTVPSSLFHYIQDGEYLPPESFLIAVDKFVPDAVICDLEINYRTSFDKTMRL